MTDHEPADDEGKPQHERTIGDEESIRDRVPSGISQRAKNGTLALLAGGLMLGRAARVITRSRGRAAIRGTVGAGLVVLGLRQRRSTDVTEETDYQYTGGEDAPDVTYTDQPDEDRPKPDLDADVGDPRRRTDDDQVEIDISESELADEPGEAAGPDPEQAQPTRTEGTEPETSPVEDVGTEDDDSDDFGMEDEETGAEDDETDGFGTADEDDESDDLGMEDDETDDMEEDDFGMEDEETDEDEDEL